MLDPIEKLENEGTVGFYSPEDGEIVRIYKKDLVYILQRIKEYITEITREEAFNLIQELNPNFSRIKE